ncbi:hypothetical protein [Jeotgalicoccus marinus]|uniref:hypothetical protein n=1 Tax=Jeotgalicoccus marinus TaxID=516700 RepID=UPI0003FADBBF|nr:hypothetical protein [Jeotgalicoccus marinus]
MKTTQNLINGEIYAILHKLAIPSEKRYSKDLYNRHFIFQVARTIQKKLPDHLINASETETEYILRIDSPKEKKGLIA